MVKPIIIKMEKLPNLDQIIVLHASSPAVFKYISSLKYALQWKISKIRGSIEYSRSGLSAWVDNLEVIAETNQHIHKIIIYDAYIDYNNHCIAVPLADWYLDGEELAILILPKYIIGRIRSIVETYIKTKDVNEGEFSIELKQCRILAPGDWY